MERVLPILTILAAAGACLGKVDLVTLPSRDTVQLTIYNSADLTLAMESRALTLKEGVNRLQFSWENTLIDPTSLEMRPKSEAGGIDVAELQYPPRVRNLGIWNVHSGVSGQAPMEISYLTSGLSWRAFYMGTLTPDEKTMRLQGYVVVTNNSGEDYENAQVRLIVGQVHLLDEIAALARRQYPYDRPGIVARGEPGIVGGARGRVMMERLGEAQDQYRPPWSEVKEVVKEGLSEYFLYTIQGTETIPTGWSKRLVSFEADEVPVVNLYKCEDGYLSPWARQDRGSAVMRFLSFKNDAGHRLGETPIPGGSLKVYRKVDAQGRLSYTGQSEFKYIPVNEDVELNLGPVSDVVVEPKEMEYRTDNFTYDYQRNVSGWDEIRTCEMTVKNTRDIPVKIEIRRNIPTQYWDLQPGGDYDAYEKVDLSTVKFTLTLNGRSERKVSAVIRTYHGERERAWK